LKRPEKASDGGLGRKLDYRAIVERHFGKHTGLRRSAKACRPRQVGDGKHRRGWCRRRPGV